MDWSGGQRRTAAPPKRHQRVIDSLSFGLPEGMLKEHRMLVHSDVALAVILLRGWQHLLLISGDGEDAYLPKCPQG
jgi:hypothetical protein